MSQEFNKASSKNFRVSRAHGLAISGLVFYLVHILQQAQARDTAVLDDTMTDLDVVVHQKGETSDAVTVASVEALEPVFIESIPSQSIETTVVVDEEEASDEVINGKDAVDVSDGGVSPLLLLGGVALIGGGVAVLANDDDSSGNDENNSEIIYQTGIVTLTGIPMVGQKVSLERVVSEDAEVQSSDDVESIFQGVLWVNDSGDIVSTGESLLFTEELESQSIHARGHVAIDGTYIAFSTEITNPDSAIFLRDLQELNDPVGNTEWYVSEYENESGQLEAVYRYGHKAHSIGYDGYGYSNLGFEAKFLELSNPLSIPEDGATLSFEISYGIEPVASSGLGWDGVSVQIRGKGESEWSNLFSDEFPYSYSENYHSQINDQGLTHGWSGINEGFLPVTMSLDDYSSKEHIIRFVFVADEYFSGEDALQNHSDGSDTVGVMLKNVKVLTKSGEDILVDSITTEDTKFDVVEFNPNNDFLDAQTRWSGGQIIDLTIPPNFTAIPENLSGLETLTSLLLANTSFSDSYYERILTQDNLPALEVLNVAAVKWNDLTTDNLKLNFPELKTLQAYNSNLSGDLESLFTDSIEYISAGGTKVGGSLEGISSAKQLHTLYAWKHDGELAGISGDGITNESLESLISLSIGGNNFQGVELGGFLNAFPSLEYFYASEARLEGSIDDLVDKPFKGLAVGGNFQLTGDINTLSTMPDLEEAYVWHTNISGTANEDFMSIFEANGGTLNTLYANGAPINWGIELDSGLTVGDEINLLIDSDELVGRTLNSHQFVQTNPTKMVTMIDGVTYYADGRELYQVSVEGTGDPKDLIIGQESIASLEGDWLITQAGHKNIFAVESVSTEGQHLTTNINNFVMVDLDAQQSVYTDEVHLAWNFYFDDVFPPELSILKPYGEIGAVDGNILVIGGSNGSYLYNINDFSGDLSFPVPNPNPNASMLIDNAIMTDIQFVHGTSDDEGNVLTEDMTIKAGYTVTDADEPIVAVSTGQSPNVIELELPDLGVSLDDLSYYSLSNLELSDGTVFTSSDMTVHNVHAINANTAVLLVGNESYTELHMIDVENQNTSYISEEFDSLSSDEKIIFSKTLDLNNDSLMDFVAIGKNNSIFTYLQKDAERLAENVDDDDLFDRVYSSLRFLLIEDSEINDVGTYQAIGENDDLETNLMISVIGESEEETGLYFTGLVFDFE